MRILFTPWGSLGDLHPYLAVAIEMKKRGHEVHLATTEIYRPKVEGEGLRFHPVRPEMTEYIDHPERMAKVMAAFRGPEHIYRGILMPALEAMFTDVAAAAHDMNLVVSHVAMPATPIVAEYLKVPWVAAVLQPAVLWSAFDPPLPGGLHRVRLPLWVARAYLRFVKAVTGRWMTEAYSLRRKLGLPTGNKHPLFGGQFSPFGTLAWFSPLFAPPRPDWPPHTIATGFPFYDKLTPEARRLSPALDEFLASGEPPVVFTLGSSAAYVPSRFYQTSFEIVERLKIRGVLLAGLDFARRTGLRSTARLLVEEYAPYGELFPRAAAIVHSGGIGTTAQALRSRRPSLIVPFSHDQPDNAARVERLGAGRSLARWSYRADRAARLLWKLLHDREVASAAEGVGDQILAENSIEAAADELERIGRGAVLAGNAQALHRS